MPAGWKNQMGSACHGDGGEDIFKINLFSLTMFILYMQYHDCADSRNFVCSLGFVTSGIAVRTGLVGRSTLNDRSIFQWLSSKHGDHQYYY